MAKVCEICGVREETDEEENSFDMLIICPDCSNDRVHPFSFDK
ncbi:hypothetical protein V7200_09660 [Cytobacillus firmus]|uniref:Uncharacterized protein n=1 Tax=Cytobacillus firmus TaxID=1399 RepID=A0A800NE34_CYTFI|nr:hypothetical protein [Cytobacillus firmus]KAF0825189.1 hypothetical protein KIS1582_0976 [Cytobacillus firmus]